MSSVTTSDAQSNWEIEKRCINLAFLVGGPLVLYGLFAGAASHIVAGAILYSGSLVATAIRDSAERS